MIIQGDALKIPLKDGSVHCCVTSPPYWGLRNYGINGQLGLEKTPEEYVANMVKVFREVWRVLRDDGTLWLNLGDSYAASRSYQVADNKHPAVGPQRNLAQASPPPGYKQKDLVGIPWMTALALRADGWYLRSAIPWLKRNCMPESVDDRPTTAVEYVFLLTKSKDYFYDAESIKVRASDDTHARYARGRREDHKWADGGPGGQTIARTFAHMAGKPISVPDSYHGSVPGRKDGPGQDRRSKTDRAPGVHPKSAEPGSGIKANSSFEEAVKDVIGSRNRRSSDWFFDSWQGMMTDEEGDPLALIVNSTGFPDAHFATFPPRLVEPMILAGTSEKGCCPKCGGPWVRITENKPAVSKECPKTVEAHHARGGTGNPVGTVGKSGGRIDGYTKTIGWKACCSCGLDPIPCTALDPFAGSGTVGQVALKYRRRAILMDLKTDYLKMAGKRTKNLQVNLL